MSIVFRTEDGQAVKTWVNVKYSSHGIPMAGDVVILHWGAYLEDAGKYVVLRRVFDGTKCDSIDLIVRSYEESDD